MRSAEQLELDIAEAERLLADADSDEASSAVVADALVQRGEALLQLHRRSGALRTADDLLARLAGTADAALLKRLVLAQRIRAAALLVLFRPAESLTAAQQVAASAEDSTEPELRWCLASALMTECGALLRLRRPAEAQVVAERLAREFAADPWQGPRKANMVGVGLLMKSQALAALGRIEEATLLLDDLLEQFRAERQPSVRSLLVRASDLKAQLLVKQDRFESALEIWEAILGEFAHAERLGLRHAMTSAAIAHASALHKLGRPEEALAIVDGVLERLADRDPRLPPELELRALAHKARYLEDLKRPEEALSTCRLFLQRHGERSSAGVSGLVVGMLRLESRLLTHAGHFDAAIDVLDQLLGEAERLKLSPNAVAVTLVSKEITLMQAGRPAEALAVCNHIIERDGEPVSGDRGVGVLEAMCQIPFALSALGRLRDAISACDNVVERFGEVSEPDAQKMVSDVLIFKAHLLSKRGRGQQALKCLGAVLQRAEASPAPELQQRASEVRARIAGIQTKLSDRRRLRIAMIAPPIAATIAVYLLRRVDRGGPLGSPGTPIIG